MAAEAEREQLESELAALRARVHQGIIECAEQERKARELREQVCARVGTEFRRERRLI